MIQDALRVLWCVQDVLAVRLMHGKEHNRRDGGMEHAVIAERVSTTPEMVVECWKKRTAEQVLAFVQTLWHSEHMKGRVYLLRLYVKVTKRSDLPKCRTIAIASRYIWAMYLGLPVKLDERTVMVLPTSPGFCPLWRASGSPESVLM